VLDHLPHVHHVEREVRKGQPHGVSNHLARVGFGDSQGRAPIAADDEPATLFNQLPQPGMTGVPGTGVANIKEPNRPLRDP
jgi:hypothetical protein